MTLKYPLVCFDLDGTLVDDTVYIWKTLHETFNTDPQRRKKAYEDYFSGAISYPEWFHHDLLLLTEAGATKSRIRAVLRALKPMQGAFEALLTLKARGHAIAVVSGSLDIVIDHLFKEVGFDHVLVNRIYFDDTGRIAGGEPTPYDLEGKADGLRKLAAIEGITPKQTEQAFAMCRERGIGTHAFIMIGAPIETMEDVEETLRLLERIRPNSVSPSIATPAPGTALYETARSEGFYNIGDWTESDYMSNLRPMNLPHLSLEQVVEARDRMAGMGIGYGE